MDWPRRINFDFLRVCDIISKDRGRTERDGDRIDRTLTALWKISAEATTFFQTQSSLIKLFTGIEALSCETVKGLHEALADMGFHSVAAHIMRQLPGGDFLRVQGDGDWTSGDQIEFRINKLPHLVSISFSKEFGEKIDKVPRFIRDIGAEALSQDHSTGVIKLYFKTDDEAMLRKLKL